MVIVAIWAVGFTATAVAMALVETLAPHSGVIDIVVQMAGNLGAALFAYRYAKESAWVWLSTEDNAARRRLDTAQ